LQQPPAIYAQPAGGGKPSKIDFQEHPMSAPSRRPEIRRRRTRKEKIVQLRKRLAAAKTDADRARVTAKLHKLAILSPGQPLMK
jgi:hypothetical protein